MENIQIDRNPNQIQRTSDGGITTIETKESYVQAQSRLLQQPWDTLEQIIKLLPPENLLALSLTCKGAFGLLFRRGQQGLAAANAECK